MADLGQLVNCLGRVRERLGEQNQGGDDGLLSGELGGESRADWKLSSLKSGNPVLAV